MNYKKSFYNVEIDVRPDGKRLVYNTYSGIYGIMDAKTQVIYNDIENVDIEKVVDEGDINNINIMGKSGFIVPYEKDELATVKLERAIFRYNRDTLGITIVPTMDCNMCCPYCYEEKNKSVMSPEVQDQLFKFVKMYLDSNPNIKKLFTSWYGGEPLMQKEIIFDLSEKFISLCEEKDIVYSSSIITNGVLLDVETALKLVNECNIKHAQITVDGMKEMHNKRRILINGEDSHGIIMQNIEDCKDIIAIVVRINVDKENISEIEELIRFFLEERGWAQNPKFYLAPVEKYDNESCVVEKSSCFQGEDFADVVEKHRRIRYNLSRESVMDEFFSKRRPVFCGFEALYAHVVDSEGYLYSCWHHAGNKERSTGHINKKFVINSEYAKWLLSDLPDQCEECTYLPMCQGGCGDKRIFKNNGEPHCFHTFYSYKDTLKLAYEDYISQKSRKETM